MTLGGLALAVGILVDDATVTIENIHRHMSLGKRMVKSILDGAHQIAIPAFVSTLCICIVFVPIFFLKGVAYYLFTPLALAVVFAMMASYFLSRTVAPTMANFLLGAEVHHPEGHSSSGPTAFSRGFTGTSFAGSNGRRVATSVCWKAPCARRCWSLFAAALFVILSLAIFLPFLGPRFLSAGRCRPVPSPCSRTERHPDRGNGERLCPGRADHPRRSSRRTKSTWCSTTSACRSAA